MFNTSHILHAILPVGLAQASRVAEAKGGHALVGRNANSSRGHGQNGCKDDLSVGEHDGFCKSGISMYIGDWVVRGVEGDGTDDVSVCV